MDRIRATGGFTLIEVLLSVVLLGLIAYGTSGLYISGMRSFDEQADRVLLDSRLRGRMEEIISRSFDQVAPGSEVVSVNGRDFTITWTVTLVDMDGDLTPDPDAKQVDISVEGLTGRTLSMILVDNQGKTGKI